MQETFSLLANNCLSSTHFTCNTGILSDVCKVKANFWNADSSKFRLQTLPAKFSLVEFHFFLVGKICTLTMALMKIPAGQLLITCLANKLCQSSFRLSKKKRIYLARRFYSSSSLDSGANIKKSQKNLVRPEIATGRSFLVLYSH